MLRLAVATRAESFERLVEPLAQRGVEVVHLRTKERTIPLTTDAAGLADTAESGDAAGLAAPADPERAGDPGDAADDPSGDGLADAAFPDLDPDVGYVFPPRDVEGAVADAMLDIPWLVDRDDVRTSRNKAEVLARCSEAGLPVSETVLVSNPVDEDAIRDAVEAVGTPVVIKPTSTTRGVGVARVGDADSALGVADYLDLVHDFAATGDKSFLVQSFVPDARDVRVMTIEGEYVGAVERRRGDGGWRHNVHRGAAASGIEPDPALQELAESVATLLDVDLLGVDLLVTEEGAVVSETNARPTIDDASKYEPAFYDRLAGAIERSAGES